MAFDLLIKNGMVVDGTGFARYRATWPSRTARSPRSAASAASAEQTIDAEGLVVAPGIIDLHTHYDVQPFWDRLCTSSVWHGVTTVLTGNCGLTLAPLRPEHREAMLATFCCVEDIPVRSLSAVVPWTWESFGEFLNAIDIGLGLNMLPLVGHNPLRLSVMDEEAWDRAATADEIAAMQRLLRGALEEGAWGWSTTVSPTHAGPKGQPVPTRLAANDERVALGRTLGEFNRGVIEILPPGAGQPDEADRQHLLDVAVASGRPVFFLGFDTGARGLRRVRDAAGRAALQPAPRHSVQPAVHAQEDHVLRQPRRVGRRHGRRRSTRRWPCSRIRRSGRRCGRPRSSGSAGARACRAASSSGRGWS